MQAASLAAAESGRNLEDVLVTGGQQALHIEFRTGDEETLGHRRQWVLCEAQGPVRRRGRGFELPESPAPEKKRAHSVKRVRAIPGEARFAARTSRSSMGGPI